MITRAHFNPKTVENCWDDFKLKKKNFFWKDFIPEFDTSKEQILILKKKFLIFEYI